MKIAGKLSENEHTAQPLHDLYKECVAELKEASELERKAASLLDEVEHVEELVGLEALTTGNEDNAQACTWMPAVCGDKLMNWYCNGLKCFLII